MTLILSGTEGVSDVDGSAATPAVRGADANTGIFFPAADTIAFAEGGTEVARITDTGAWSFGASGTATGTSGQALVSGGSGAAPAWGTLAAAGGGTGLTAPGTSGNVLTSNGTAWTSTAPTVTAPAGTTGQVQINNAGAFGAVGSGTTGQVLTSQGTGAAPLFASPPAAGSWIHLSTVTASNSATVDVESTFDSTYDAYAIVATNVSPSNNTVSLRVRLKIGGTYLTSGYAYTSNITRSITTDGQTVSANATNEEQIVLVESLPNNAALAGSAANFSLFLNNPSSGSMIKSIYSQGVAVTQGASIAQSSAMNTSAINRSNVSALTGVRFYFTSGNVSTGTFRLYGIKNS
jgi:hypothetical protein